MEKVELEPLSVASFFLWAFLNKVRKLWNFMEKNGSKGKTMVSLNLAKLCT